MKELKPQIVRHGEVLLVPISSLPKEATLKESVSESIIAHSETGHHHVLKTTTKDAVKIYTTLDGNTFADVSDIAELLHKKTGRDVHKTHKIAPSIYKIVLKKEFNYYEGVIKTVMD